jgi:hypothetical protein
MWKFMFDAMEKKRKPLTMRDQPSQKSTSMNIKPNQQCIETIVWGKLPRT